MKNKLNITDIFDEIQQVSYDIASITSNMEEMAGHLHEGYEARHRKEGRPLTTKEEQELKDDLMKMLVDLEKIEKILKPHSTLIGADCI